MRKPETIMSEIGKLNHELVKSRELYNKERTLVVINSFIFIEEIHYNLPKGNEELIEWVTDFVKKRIHITAKPKRITESKGTIYYCGNYFGSEMFTHKVEVFFR